MSPSDSKPHLDGDGLHVRQDGPREAPVLLLIHGSASSVRSWDALVPLLAASYRVIRVDLLGHGRSPKPDDLSYAVPEQARRVGETLDRLGVRSAVVVGHSSGGATATALAERRPDLVRALVLVNSGPGLHAYIAPPMAIEPSQWPDLTDEQLREFASSAFSRAGYTIPRELLDEVREMTFHSLVSTMQGTSEYLTEKALPDRLACLGKPLLVIFGEDDRRWRPSSAAEYGIVPDARIVMLPGIGHSPMLEDPPSTAAQISSFVEDVVR
ncbi:alpha/beta fold hydrolase [Actinomadura gamaensis]|uniref:Alpha/beta fold hydrolase n=1 Tax=Actinomadura gamaensis TaxID=1763541 RepID=A0ABV9TXX9_9ACTN